MERDFDFGETGWVDNRMEKEICCLRKGVWVNLVVVSDDMSSGNRL